MMVNRGVVRMEVRVNSKEREVNATIPGEYMMKRDCVFDTYDTGLVMGVE